MIRDIGQLPHTGRVLVDSAPIIYFLEGHHEFATRFDALFARAESGNYELVISTVTLIEVLTGPLRQGDEKLAHAYRQALTSPPTWIVADLTPEIAHRAARIRGETRLRVPDAVQVATALELSCGALITHDRDFAALDGSSESIAVYC